MAPPPMSNRWFRRLLALCPTAIGLLWVAGMARFRDYHLTGRDWAVLVALAFALAAIVRTLQRSRPMPPIPERTNPAALAATAAGILGVLAFVFGGVFELIVGPMYPTEVGIGLRTTWHAACAFGASYCTLLLRLTQPRTAPPPASPPDAR